MYILPLPLRTAAAMALPSCSQLLLTLVWMAVVAGPLAYLLSQLFGQPALHQAEWEMVCTAMVIEHRKCVIAAGQVIKDGFYIIAVGQQATGLVAIGQLALGLVSVGQAGIGVFFSVFMGGINIGIMYAMVGICVTSPGMILGWELIKLPTSRSLLSLFVYYRSSPSSPLLQHGPGYHVIGKGSGACCGGTAPSDASSSTTTTTITTTGITRPHPSAAGYGVIEVEGGGGDYSGKGGKYQPPPVMPDNYTVPSTAPRVYSSSYGDDEKNNRRQPPFSNATTSTATIFNNDRNYLFSGSKTAAPPPPSNSFTTRYHHHGQHAHFEGNITSSSSSSRTPPSIPYDAAPQAVVPAAPLATSYPPPAESVVVSAVAVEGPRIEERLRQLKDLRDREIITEVEYQQRRGEILQSI